MVPALLAAIAALTIATGCGAGARTAAESQGNARTAPSELTVGAAASLTGVLNLVAQDYTKSHPETRVYLSFGASSTIARQIQAGAPMDLFFSADEDQMDLLETAGLVLEGSRRDILGNRLAFLISEKQQRTARRLDDILQDAATVVALCDPSVPIGNYARQYMQKLGLYERLLPRSIKLENAMALLTAVDSGNVDLALVFETDAAAAKTARVIHVVPANEGPKIVYPAAMVKKTRSPAESQKLMDYLTSPAASERFRQAGFQILKR